jgi:demethylmenaquinone methyltransferase/2-methoxy-6-polyprenyl-1,4-benzoquinol methylase
MTEMSGVPRSKQEAKAVYDRLSRWYDMLSGLAEGPSRKIGVRLLNAQPGEMILEIGFGTGHQILAIAQAVGPTGSVYGIDISEGMNRITQARIQEAGLSDRVVLTCQDATSLPYPLGFFDALFLSFTLELFDTPEIPLFLAECHRVVKDGGRICVVALAKRERDSWAVRLYEWAHRRFPKSIDCRPIFVEQALTEARFLPIAIQRLSMFSLPVDVLIAGKASSS